MFIPSSYFFVFVFIAIINIISFACFIYVSLITCELPNNNNNKNKIISRNVITTNILPKEVQDLGLVVYESESTTNMPSQKLKERRDNMKLSDLIQYCKKIKCRICPERIIHIPTNAEIAERRDKIVTKRINSRCECGCNDFIIYRRELKDD